MSHPSSSKGNLMSSENIIPQETNSKKMIIITRHNLHSAKSHTSKLTYEEGPYSIQCDMGKNTERMDKQIIDNTVKILQETIKKKGKEQTSDRKHSSVQPSDKPVISNTSSENNDIDNSLSNNIPTNHIVMTTLNNDMNECNIVTTGNEMLNDNETAQYNKLQAKAPYLNTKASNTNQLSTIQTMIILNSSYNQTQNFPMNDDTTFTTCLICDKIYPMSSLYSARGCQHLLCRKCIKNYYEEKIEQGERTFKCPVFKCSCMFDLAMIKEFISNEHFNVINGNKKSLLNIKLSLPPLNKQYETIKKYSMHNVIDINSNENFYVYNKAKVQFCPKCGEQALFGKSGAHFVKCLNCNYCLCKYCMKEFDGKHMDITTEEHCKVFFRKNDELEFTNTRDTKQSHIGLNLLIQFLFVVCSYIFMFTAGFLYIKEGVEFVFPCYYQNILRNSIVLIVSIALFFTAIPIILMSFPYFPVFIAIMD